MGRDYDMHERRNFGGQWDWDDADHYQDREPFGDLVSRRSGWSRSPVTARVEDDERRERRPRDRERYDEVDEQTYIARRPDVERGRSSRRRFYDQDRPVRREWDAQGPEYYRRAGDRDTWYRPDEENDNRNWERREPRDYYTTGRTVSYRDYDDEDRLRGRERGREREVRYYRPEADYEYDRDRERGFRAGRDYDQPSPQYYREAGEGAYEWRQAGPHAGRGPRGYRRSTARIEEEICDRLTHHGHLDATDINVQVEGDEVTLTGFVDSRWAKRKAEELAESVRGVRDVHNRLRIRPEGPTEQGEGYRDVYSPAAQSTGMRVGDTATRNMTEGMTVRGQDGDEIGTIKDVRVNDFLVDRSMARDVYVPFDAVVGVTADGVRLSVGADEVDGMDWKSPELTGSDDNTETTTA